MGMIALLVIVFSTVTTTFADAYSAATNIANLIKTKAVNLLQINAGIRFTDCGYYFNGVLSELFIRYWGGVHNSLFAILFVSVFDAPTAFVAAKLSLVVDRRCWLFVVAEAGLSLGDDLLPTIGAGVRRLPNRFITKSTPLMTD